MATEVLVHNSSRHDKPKKNRRAKSRNRDNEEEEPLSPRDEMKSRTKAGFEELLKQAVTQSQDEKSKKKKKRVDEQVLESLRKGDGLRKDEDKLLIANIYDPDDHKGKKSNKQRQKEHEKKSGTDNEAFEKDEIILTRKTKKKDKKDIISDDKYDKDQSITELASVHQTKGDKKKQKKKQKESETSFMSEPTEVQTPAEVSEQEVVSSERKKRRKKKVERDIEEYEEHLKHQEEDQSELNSTAVEEQPLSQGEETESARGKRRKKKRKEPEEDEIIREEQEAAAAAAVRSPREPDVQSLASPREAPDTGRITAITIHRTDKLKTDFWMSHPLVRVTLVNTETGNYIVKQHRDRAVTSYFENKNENVDYVLPIMTQPFDFKQNKSTLPIWEELLVLNENFNYFVQQKLNVIVFFELLDFVTMKSASSKYAVLKSEGGWHRIAWGFLKLVGSNGTLNTDRKVRLQLYQPPTRFRSKGGTPEVYQWWKANLKVPYPSTLYVTVKGIIPPDKVEPAPRSMFATQQEKGQSSLDDIELAADRMDAMTSARAARESARLRGPSLWEKLPGQVCKIPNSLCLALHGGKKGCLVIRFSHDGKTLACACHDKDGYVIYMYEIPSGKFKGEIQAHFSLIYDLCWSRGDAHLISGSADGTAKIWGTEKLSNRPVKTLPHPSFVYSTKFHPRVSKVVVTAGYDRILRVWTVGGDDAHGQLVQELDGHSTFVNSLAFDEEGQQLYSADSAGDCFVWNVHVTDKPSSNGLLRDWTLNKKVEDAELKGVVLNNLKVHPNGRRLLVHGRDNTIRMVDLRINAIMQRYNGALNFREHLRSAISPCGTFVAAGSEDCCAYIWNTETGDQVAMYNELSYKTSVCDVAFHPHEHMIAFCSFSDNSPILIYKYDHKVAQHNAGFETESTAGDDLRRRARSPDLHPGYEPKIENETMESTRTQVHQLQTDFRAGELSRLERVTRKLQSVSAFSSFRATSPDLPHTVTRALSPPTTYMGTTFDTGTSYYDTTRARSPEPALFSPHSSRPGTAVMEHQQHMNSQSQYLKSTGSGWRPGFSEIGRSGSPRRPGSPSHMGRPPQLALTASQGKPQFTFQGKTNKMEEHDLYTPELHPVEAAPVFPQGGLPVHPHHVVQVHRSYGGTTQLNWPGQPQAYWPPQANPAIQPGKQVVALYDYQAQRSDEISFVQGDRIRVLYKDTDSWWMGELQDGQQGFFPANYVAGYADHGAATDILPEYVPKAKHEQEGDTEDEGRQRTVTAVKMRSGELKFMSGTEDSDVEASARRKKTTRQKGQDSVSLENEEIPLSASRRRRRSKASNESLA